MLSQFIGTLQVRPRPSSPWHRDDRHDYAVNLHLDQAAASSLRSTPNAAAFERSTRVHRLDVRLAEGVERFARIGRNRVFVKTRRHSHLGGLPSRRIPVRRVTGTAWLSRGTYISVWGWLSRNVSTNWIAVSVSPRVNPVAKNVAVYATSLVVSA